MSDISYELASSFAYPLTRIDNFILSCGWEHIRKEDGYEFTGFRPPESWGEALKGAGHNPDGTYRRVMAIQFCVQYYEAKYKHIHGEG